MSKGNDDYCQSYLKCGLGEGDCDTNDDCKKGLMCVQSQSATSEQRCKGSEYDPGDDCCQRGKYSEDASSLCNKPIKVLPWKIDRFLSTIDVL